MTDHLETYTLRKPVTVQQSISSATDQDFYLDQGDGCGMYIYETAFNQMFVRVSEQKQQLREQIEEAFEKWNKWRPYIDEEVRDFGPDEDGNPDFHCVGLGVSKKSLEEKSAMIDEFTNTILGLVGLSNTPSLEEK